MVALGSLNAHNVFEDLNSLGTIGLGRLDQGKNEFVFAAGLVQEKVGTVLLAIEPLDEFVQQDWVRVFSIVAHRLIRILGELI